MASESSPEEQKAISKWNLNENAVDNNEKTTPQPQVKMGLDAKTPLETLEHCKPDEDLGRSLRKTYTDKKNISDEIVVVGTTVETVISTIESSSYVAEDKTASNERIESLSIHLENSQKSQIPLTDGRMVDDEVRTNSESDICENLQSGNFKAQTEHDISLEVLHSDTEISDTVQKPVFDAVQATTQNEQHSTIGDISSPITSHPQPSQEDNLHDSMDEYIYSSSVSGDSANMRSHTETSANDYDVVRNGSTNKEIPETQETTSRVININCQDNKEETIGNLYTAGNVETSEFEPTDELGIPETTNEEMKTTVDTKLEKETDNMSPEKPSTPDNCSDGSLIVNRRDETALTAGGSDEKIVQIPEEVGNGCKVS